MRSPSRCAASPSPCGCDASTTDNETVNFFLTYARSSRRDSSIAVVWLDAPKSLLIPAAGSFGPGYGYDNNSITRPSDDGSGKEFSSKP
jgi:hypothetical protein